MKRLNQSLCWVLVCAMVLSLVAVPISTQAAVDTVTIYVDTLGSGWSNVNVYTWNADGECTGSWPGSPMTHVEGFVYSFEVPVAAASIIFNDGSTQTGDLTIPTDGRNKYLYASNIWSSHVSSDCDHNWSAGRCTLCGGVCDHNWIDGICRKCGSYCGHKWSNGTCMVCNLICGHRNWVDGACVDCSMICSHRYDGGRCTVCGVSDPDHSLSAGYALVGYINGANYGCEDDYANIGQYLFTNGSLVVTFTQDSYVFLKTTDNRKWLMTHGYTEAKAAIFYDTNTGVGEKMFVPGNVSLTFTLTENEDGSVTLSYLGDIPECEHTYSSQLLNEASCVNYAIYKMTCTACGDSFVSNTQELTKRWLYAVPSGLTGSFDTGTVYRYRDQESGTWRRYSTKQVVYVSDWPAGFDPSNELYSLYNNAHKKAAPFENSAAKQVIDSDSVGGYLYYHWCDAGHPYSVAEKSGSYDRFHAYFSNTPPSDADQADPGDNSYCFNDATACEDCKWYFAVPVSSQVYSTYTANFGWGAWSDWSTSAITASATRQVQSNTMYISTEARMGDHSYTDGVCTLCGAADSGQETSTVYYLVGFINGEDVGCNNDYENMGPYQFVDGSLDATFESDSYVFVKTQDNGKWLLADSYCTDTECTFSEGKTEKLFVPGGTPLSFTLAENGDGSVTISYTRTQNECVHNYVGKIQPPVCEQPTVTVYTCTLCGHSYNEESNPWPHNYVNGTCTICGGADPNYVIPEGTFYLVGYINGANYGCDEDSANMGQYKFVNGKLVASFTQDSYVFLKTEGNGAWYLSMVYSPGPRCNFYNAAERNVSEKMFVPGGVEVTFYLSEGYSGSLDLSYTTPSMVCPHTSHNIDGICDSCGYQLNHVYENGVCSCGAVEPVTKPVEYFLFGYINGANYGCEEDAANMGQYRFVDGKLVATFTETSYVGVKTTDNADWFMTNGYVGEINGCRLYNTTTLGNPNKLYVPGGVEVTFTLEVNWDKTLTLHYTTAEIESSVVPTLTLKAPTLEFKDMITVNAFYTAENIQDVVEMGMITYSSNVDRWSVATAENVIPGATYEEASGRYFSRSQGIHAKFLGDTVYLAIYAKLKDGTYAYSKLASYSAVQYATNQLKNSTDAKLKQLVAAMLNYGAEAQLYFGHNTSALANASMTADQKALPAAYSSGMVGSVPAASAAKQGSFANNQGFASRKPAVSFEGAFCINYFFTPNYAPDNGITLYYWDAADYNANSVLTTANATGSIQMSDEGDSLYRGDVTQISAKDLSSAIYVAAVYHSGGTTWTSGVLGYSIGFYCSNQASSGSTIAGLAKATAVYGHHAKAYFG